MTSCRIRTLIRKCVHWADKALEQSPKEYYKTPEWKKAVQYARNAQTLARSTTETCHWTPLEQQILTRGYPTFRNQVLWDATEHPRTDLDAPAFVDPLEALQEQYTQLQRRHEETVSKLECERHAANDRNVRLQAEHEAKTKLMQDRISQLSAQCSDLQEELEFERKAHLRQCEVLRARLASLQADNTDQQTQLAHFKHVCERAVSLMTDTQRNELHSFVDDAAFTPDR